MRKTLALAVTALTTTGLAALLPTAADAASNTDLTFSVQSGGLSLNVPTSATLTASGGGALTLGLTAGSVSATLSGVQVTDNRGGLALNGWQVSLSPMSGFAGVDGQGASVGSIAASNGNLTASAVSLSGLTGANLVVPTAGGVALDTGGTVISAPASASLLNSYSATFDETVSVTVPTSTNPGTYTGTITQTVA